MVMERVYIKAPIVNLSLKNCALSFCKQLGVFLRAREAKRGLTECRGQGSHVGIQVKAPHQELGLCSSWVNLEAWWKAHVLRQVILIELSLRGGRHGSQAKSTVLHLSHILLK